MALFGASVLLLLGFIYWSTIAVIAHQTDESIKTEISWLTGLYTDHGLSSLISTINERSARSRRSSSYYAVSSADKRLLAGNIPVRFDLTPEQLGWKNIEMNEARTTGRVVQIRVRSVQLDGGEYLLVGRDRRQLIVSQKLIIPALLWGLIIMIVLAILGGLVMGRSVLRHIEQINSTVREIMDGDLSRRIPGNNSSDEFDQLANNLNGMLDEIERLMAGIRQVSNNVAHDLRTPLTRLRNQLEELRAGFTDDSPYYEYIEKSIEYADQLLSTFSALLRIARIDAGGQKTNMKLIDVALLLNDAKELYEAVAESKKISIRSEVEGLPTFLGDRDLLFQAVTNLLDN
jgi:signal transduction histidine kinase